MAGEDFIHAGDVFFETEDRIEQGRSSPELLHDARRTFGETYRALHRASATLYLESPRDLARKARLLRDKAGLAYRQLTDETIADTEGMDMHLHRMQYRALMTRIAVEMHKLLDLARPHLMTLEHQDWNWDQEPE
ncbi:hypothetical protein [Actinacidiphila oryziradicis]|uniref:hypothetical protein n=1 Tax=Actinacidiphila oryziradicis TaxID=2571141 RepID=UPI0023F3A83C|nr:hypothetical protein [Actinacidiphila oryziradicis]MCW2874162.1 hypothetical protein [Actinacidiphila oryziradicis]